MPRGRVAFTLATSAFFACSCPKRGDAPRLPERSSDDEVRPVYATAPEHPLAVRLCRALQTAASDARARCCHTSPGASLALECARNLSAALQSKALSLEADGVDLCASAIAKLHDGCDWVGPTELPPPEECTTVLVGHLAAGQVCRSSLECEKDLRCVGAGPTATGRCGSAGAPGFPCGLAVDVLEAYLHQDLDRTHPECLGYCERRQCHPALDAGSACAFSRQCARGFRCADGRCVEGGTAKLNQRCSGDDCEAGARCVLGRCLIPKPPGVACDLDAECRGACLRNDGGPGTCAMRCDVL